MGVQFVTHLKIERIETHEGAGERQVGKILVQTGRQVTEVGSVTVKASSLAALARKIGAHVELFDDSDERAISIEHNGKVDLAAMGRSDVLDRRDAR